ncbi:MAG: addiction module protein [Candidatus Riflebacteria bacterium]|nr:addiction module protein [Candidatus Riflebacteria bacterium]
MKTKDLIAEAILLPIEERAIVVDSLLKSLNPPELENDKKWVTVAKRRLQEMRSGKVKGIPGEEVFEKIWNRFSK